MHTTNEVFDLKGPVKWTKTVENTITEGGPYPNEKHSTTVKLFNKNGLLSSKKETNNSFSFQDEFEYNANNQLILQRRLDELGSLLFVDSLVYTEFDSIQEKHHKNGNASSFLQYRYTYDTTNLLVYKEYFQKSEKLFSYSTTIRTDSVKESISGSFGSDMEFTDGGCWKQFLDPDGKVIKTELYDFEKGHFLTNYFDYDSIGRLIAGTYDNSWMFKEKREFKPTVISDVTAYSFSCTFDSVGRITQQIKSTFPGVNQIRKYTYNEYGKVILEEITSQKIGEQATGKGNKQVYKYDQKTNLLKSIRVKAKGYKMQFRFKYDSQLNWTEITEKSRYGNVNKEKYQAIREIEYYP